MASPAPRADLDDNAATIDQMRMLFENFDEETAWCDDDSLSSSSAADNDADDGDETYLNPQYANLDPFAEGHETDSDTNSEGRLSTIAPSVAAVTEPEDLPTYINRQHLATWVNDETIPKQSRLARRIVTIARLGLISCQSHSTARDGTQSNNRARHFNPVNDSTCGLNGVLGQMESNAKWMRDARHLGIERKDELTYARKQFPHRSTLPKAKVLEAIACGESPPHRSPHLEVLLDADHDPNTRIHRVKFDVDSFLNVIPDIAAFKDSIEYTPIRQPARKLNRNIHIPYPIINPETRTFENIPLHKIPHTYFGSIQGQTVYILFPGIYWCTRSRHSSLHGPTQLRDEEHRMFYDEIIIPSVKQTFEESQMGHIALSYGDILNKVTFSQKRSARGAPPPYGFALPSSHLRRLSESLKVTVAKLPPAPDYGESSGSDKVNVSMLKDFFFLLDAKNTKVRYGGAGDAKSCLANFWEKQHNVVSPADEPSVNNPQLIDLAVEWSPGGDEEATILLARRCCQVNTLRFLYGDVEPALLATVPPEQSTPHGSKISGGQHHYYNVNLLRDSVSATTEPGLSLRSLGLHYFQSYTVGKEVLDAAGSKPYANDVLLHGGYADSVMVRMLSKSSELITSRNQFDDVLTKSHNFFRQSVKSNDKRHFSWRAEWRCTSTLAQCVAAEDTNWIACDDFMAPNPAPAPQDPTPQAQTPTPQGPTPTPQAPTSQTPARKPKRISNAAFFCIQSETYWRFVLRSIRFYTYVMDLITINHQGDTTPPTASLLYAVMMILARSFINPISPRFHHILFSPNQIPTASGLAPANPGQERKKGLGLLAIMESRGFGYLPAGLVDWKTFCLHYSMESNFSIPGLMTSVHKNKFLTIKDSPESLFSLLLHLLENNSNKDKIKVILILISHLILRRYRKAALESMIFKNRPEEQQACVDQDTIPFTFPALKHYINACGQRAVKSGSNRTTKWRTLENFWDFTWEDLPPDPNLGPTRLQPQSTFKNNDWRCFWRSAREAIAARVRRAPKGSSDWLATFEERHWQHFFTHHTTFPYPAENGGLSKQGNAKKERSLLCTVINPSGDLVLSMNPREEPRTTAQPIPTAYHDVWTANDINRLVDAAGR